MRFEKPPMMNPSLLTHGRHPGYLLTVREEDKPEVFTLNTYPTIFRWYCAIWEDVAAMRAGVLPEEHDGISTPVFSPARKKPASKAFLWTQNILGRPLTKDEEDGFELPDCMPCGIWIEQRVDSPGRIKIVNFDAMKNPPARPPAAIQALYGKYGITAPWEPAGLPMHDEEKVKTSPGNVKHIPSDLFAPSADAPAPQIEFSVADPEDIPF